MTARWLVEHGWRWFGLLMLVGCPAAMLLLWIVTARRERKEHEAWLARKEALRAAGICTICEGTGFELNERAHVCWACLKPDPEVEAAAARVVFTEEEVRGWHEDDI